MVRTALTAVLAAALIFCGACREAARDPAPTASAADTSRYGALEDFAFGGDFTLVDHHAKPAHLADFRGRPVLLFFGYTSCPDACPLTMSKIVRALDAVPGGRPDVTTLFVSVDVDHDPPETLARYVTSFGVPMIGLTGTRQQIDQVVAQYRAAYRIDKTDSAAGYTVAHSVHTYLIDRRGKLRYIFHHDEAPQVLADAIQLVLKEPA